MGVDKREARGLGRGGGGNGQKVSSKFVSVNMDRLNYVRLTQNSEKNNSK